MIHEWDVREGGREEEAGEENWRSMAKVQEGGRGKAERRECCCVGGVRGVGGFMDWLAGVAASSEREALGAGVVEVLAGGVASGFRVVAGRRGGGNDGRNRRGSKSP
jgi:hypothetical protein